MRRSILSFNFLQRATQNWSPRFSTSFHSFVPDSEKNFMAKCPGLPLTPGVPLTPGLFGCPFIPGTPGTPLTNPSHFPMQTPQSLLPLISIALSPPFSSKVQHFCGLLTCSLVGSMFPRSKCPVLTTQPDWLITSTEENISKAECTTRQVNACRRPLSSTQCSDISQGTDEEAKEAGERKSVGELSI